MAEPVQGIAVGTFMRVTTAVGLVGVVAFGAYVRNNDVFGLMSSRRDESRIAQPPEAALHLSPVSPLRTVAIVGERGRTSLSVTAEGTVHDVTFSFPGRAGIYLEAHPPIVELLHDDDVAEVVIEGVGQEAPAGTRSYRVRATGCSIAAEPCPLPNVVEEEQVFDVVLEAPVPNPRPDDPGELRVVLRGDGLGVVDFGATASEAVAALERALGPSDADSGWHRELLCPGDLSRTVTFSNLTLLLARTEGRRPVDEFIGYWYGRGSSPSKPLTLVEPEGGRIVGRTVASLEAEDAFRVTHVTEQPWPSASMKTRHGRFYLYLDDKGRVVTANGGLGCGE